MFAGTQRYAFRMVNDFWFRVGIIGLGAAPVLLVIGSLFLE